MLGSWESIKVRSFQCLTVSTGHVQQESASAACTSSGPLAVLLLIFPRSRTYTYETGGGPPNFAETKNYGKIYAENRVEKVHFEKEKYRLCPKFLPESMENAKFRWNLPEYRDFFLARYARAFVRFPYRVFWPLWKIFFSSYCKDPLRL